MAKSATLDPAARKDKFFVPQPEDLAQQGAKGFLQWSREENQRAVGALTEHIREWSHEAQSRYYLIKCGGPEGEVILVDTGKMTWDKKGEPAGKKMPRALVLDRKTYTPLYCGVFAGFADKDFDMGPGNLVKSDAKRLMQLTPLPSPHNDGGVKVDDVVGKRPVVLVAHEPPEYNSKFDPETLYELPLDGMRVHVGPILKTASPDHRRLESYEDHRDSKYSVNYRPEDSIVFEPGDRKFSKSDRPHKGFSSWDTYKGDRDGAYESLDSVMDLTLDGREFMRPQEDKTAALVAAMGAAKAAGRDPLRSRVVVDVKTDGEAARKKSLAPDERVGRDRIAEAFSAYYIHAARASGNGAIEQGGPVGDTVLLSRKDIQRVQ
ncbi:MAG: hypothetical protein ABIH11_02540 [Candidatus Altiarchaeota archaeon]